jgi:hypothetical protein
MKKRIFTSLVITLFSITSFAASTRQIHNQEFELLQKQMKMTIPTNMQDCPITGVKNQSWDPVGLIDYASFAEVSKGSKTISTFFVYRNDESSEALPFDELKKIVITQRNEMVEKVQVEIYHSDSKTFELDTKSGKIDWPGYKLTHVYNCDHSRF